MIGPEQENGNGNSDIFATSNIIVPEEVITQIGTLNNNQINAAKQLLLLYTTETKL